MPGQDRGEVAGVGDRRAAGEPQRGGHLGGDDHRQRGLAEARRTRTAARGRARGRGGGPPRAPGPSWSRTRSWPTTSSRVRGPQRRLDGALVALGLGGGQRAAGGPPPAASRSVSRGRPSLRPCSGVRRAARSRAPTSGASPASRRDGVDGLVGVLGRPAEADQALVDLVAPRAAAAAARPATGAPVGAPIRSLSSRMIRWAPFWPMPGTRVSVLTSSLGDRACAGRRARARRASPGRASGPTPGRGLHQLEGRASRPRRGSRTGSASPRAPPCWSAASPAGRCAASASVPGVHISSRPTPPTSSDGAGEADGGDLAADERDHARLLPAVPRAARRARRRSGPARRRARCG